jgi:hypothetical protein
MKALSIALEFRIILTDEEINSLGEGLLSGKLISRDKAKLLKDRPMTIQIGMPSTNQHYLDIKKYPEDLSLEMLDKIEFLLSRAAYVSLKSKGIISENISKIPECSMIVCSDRYYQSALAGY